MEDNKALIKEIKEKIFYLDKSYYPKFAHFLVREQLMIINWFTRSLFYVISKMRNIDSDLLWAAVLSDSKYGRDLSLKIILQMIKHMEVGKDQYKLAETGGFCQVELRLIEFELAKYEINTN